MWELVDMRYRCQKKVCFQKITQWPKARSKAWFQLGQITSGHLRGFADLRPSPSANPFRWFLLVDKPLLTFYAVVQRFAVIVYSASPSPLCCRNQTKPCWSAPSPNNLRATSSDCPATHHHYRTTWVECEGPKWGTSTVCLGSTVGSRGVSD
jgi:hypothetical protein